MQILIVSATYLEIKKIIEEFEFIANSEIFYHKSFAENEVDILIAGIGMPFTIYNLTKALLRKKYDIIINVGIAGSFSGNLKIGEVVQVKNEEFADLGIRSKDSFSTLFDTGFIKTNIFPFVDGKLKATNLKNLLIPELVRVNGITVNAVNGNKKEIEELKKKFNPDIESMEGAAVFYVCLMEKVAFTEIRSISNYVEERNKENWDIPLAINNLIKITSKILLSI